MRYSYTPTGVHSKSIEFDLEDNIVKNVQIIGGCDGNNKGMAALAEGRTAEDVIRLLSGIPCGKKPTSCPDQLAKAVAEAIGKVRFIETPYLLYRRHETALTNISNDLKSRSKRSLFTKIWSRFVVLYHIFSFKIRYVCKTH